MERTMTAIYQADIIEIGDEVELFLTENMVVIFNETVPADLKEIGVIHQETKLLEDIRAGDYLDIDGSQYRITFIGNKVNETMREMGHCTIAFNGSDTSDLPGTICVEKKLLPEFKVGSKLSFYKA